MEVKSELVDAQFEMIIDEAALAALTVKISKVVFVLSSQVTYVGTTAGWTRLGGGGILGQTLSSELKPSEFAVEAGATWILADGRDITGSDLHSTTGRTSAPDHRGLVLRGINEDEDNLGSPRVDGLADPDGQKAVGSSHASKTAVNGLSAASNGSHQHNAIVENQGSGGSNYSSISATGWKNAISQDPPFSRPPVGESAGSHTHTLSGDNETVSAHGSTYIYVKINR